MKDTRSREGTDWAEGGFGEECFWHCQQVEDFVLRIREISERIWCSSCAAPCWLRTSWVLGMDRCWIQSAPEVISSANDFVAAFSVESILKLLHDFDCADLVKFREKLPQFPDAMSTSWLCPNEDVQAIRSKFAREFWLASGKEAVKNIARLNLLRLVFLETLVISTSSQNFSCFSYIYFFSFLSLLKKRNKEGALHIQNPLPKITKTKNHQTQARKTLAIAATTAVMVVIPPNMRKIPRRLTSRAKLWWTFALRGPCVYL
jgi:hypothetical protein